MVRGRVLSSSQRLALTAPECDAIQYSRLCEFISSFPLRPVGAGFLILATKGVLTVSTAGRAYLFPDSQPALPRAGHSNELHTSFLEITIQGHEAAGDTRDFAPKLGEWDTVASRHRTPPPNDAVGREASPSL